MAPVHSICIFSIHICTSYKYIVRGTMYMRTTYLVHTCTRKYGVRQWGEGVLSSQELRNSAIKATRSVLQPMRSISKIWVSIF